MKSTLAASILIVVSLSIVVTAWAAGPLVKPGKWEFTIIINMPMMPQPQKKTETKCITAEKASRDPLAAILKEGQCKILSRKERGNSLDFELECSGDMNVKSKGKGRFTADGTTASGKMKITMNMPDMPNMPKMGGQGMTMTQEWEGKRLGNCD
ncbi:MAG: DUF3617 domain-containing protein [Candidatus Binatia bacterium]